MNTSQSKYDQMKLKLREGSSILSEASTADSYKLGAALIKIHGALEDFVRLEIARKAPHLQNVVEDVRQSTWNDLIGYGKEFLNFTESDARMITRANRQRQDVAHGGNYSGTRTELEEYLKFVQKTCHSEAIVQVRQQPTQRDERLNTYKPPPAAPQAHKNSHPVSSSPSSCLLWLTFFLLPPVWAILIIRDRNQGVFAKSFAYLNLFTLLLLCGFVLFPYLGLSTLPLNTIPSRVPSVRPPIESPATITIDKFTPVSETNGTCTIVWVEHDLDNLAGKNRSMVWDEIVSIQVSGSEMTAREFYDLVAEHNPHLVTDGYEFKAGKTYLLPECQ